MSISQFKTNLKTYVRNWCEANGQSITNGKSWGLAFENFVLARLVPDFRVNHMDRPTSGKGGNLGKDIIKLQV